MHIHCGSGTKSGTALRILLYLESNPLLCKPSVIRPEYAPALSGALKGAGLINDCTGFLDTWRILSTPIPALAWFCGLIREPSANPNKLPGAPPADPADAPITCGKLKRLRLPILLADLCNGCCKSNSFQIHDSA